jgi:hypothetical protein
MCISIKSFVEIKVVDVTKLTAQNGKVNKDCNLKNLMPPSIELVCTKV